MLKLISAWLLLIGVIIFGARKKWGDTPTEAVSQPVPVHSGPSEEDLVLLKAVIPQCGASLVNFIAAGTPEERNQFVLNPIATASRMARFYSMNPLIAMDPMGILLEDQSIIRLPGGRAVESQWRLQDGKQLTAVFREENGEWRLDWNHFARFSDFPWALFLAGDGPSEGEFRLLARERLAEERKLAESLSLVLYAPISDNPGTTGFQSTEFLVSRKSRNGLLLDAAFKLARNGKQVFDSHLPNLNPREMIPVRVKVRRYDAGLERKFEITEVLACHWYSVDDPGVTPAAPVGENPPKR